jgi:3-hydroxyacyl-[acyl-carrier protein] dehydratase / trans-2-decenoyl-[acyl-carrier protein] isomerase
MTVLAMPTASAAQLTFQRKSSYTEEEMRAYAHREYGPDIPPLPSGQWHMLHRITEIREGTGTYGAGAIAIAEYDVDPNAQYFAEHFKDDPIMPGALGLDAMQQLAGFLLAWHGPRGSGMALGVDGVKYRDVVRPDAGMIQIEVESIQVKLSDRLSMIRAKGSVVSREGKMLYTADEIRIGVKAR